MAQSFVKMWSEGIALDYRKRTPHLNPTEVGTAGMDQVDTASVPPKSYPPAVDLPALEELADLKRQLTGRPHSLELTEKDREKLRARIEELSQQLNVSPDDADQTYGIKKVPVGEGDVEPAADPTKVNLDKVGAKQKPWASFNDEKE